MGLFVVFFFFPEGGKSSIPGTAAAALSPRRRGWKGCGEHDKHPKPFLPVDWQILPQWNTDRQPRTGAEPELSWSPPGSQNSPSSPKSRRKEPLPRRRCRAVFFPASPANAGLSHHLAQEKSRIFPRRGGKWCFLPRAKHLFVMPGWEIRTLGSKAGILPRCCVWGDLLTNCFSKLEWAAILVMWWGCLTPSGVTADKKKKSRSVPDRQSCPIGINEASTAQIRLESLPWTLQSAGKSKLMS